MSKNIAIGDRVRLLTGKEEGIVRGVNRDVVEVEIEDGFIIPVLSRELVVIDAAEKEAFSRGMKTGLEVQEQKPEAGYYFALVESKIGEMTMYIINQSNFQIQFSAYRSRRDRSELLQYGSLKASAFAILGTIMTKTIEDAPAVSISILPLPQNSEKSPLPIAKSVQIKKQWLFQENHPIPLLQLKGKLINLSEDATQVTAEQLKNSFFEKKDTPARQESQNLPSLIPDELDLHIETLLSDHSSLSSAEILSVQISRFEKTLDQAISAGKDEITFIHGVGNGTLKYNLQKRLSGHPHVKYFEDARKEKFGFGATHVKFT